MSIVSVVDSIVSSVVSSVVSFASVLFSSLVVSEVSVVDMSRLGSLRTRRVLNELQSSKGGLVPRRWWRFLSVALE